MKSLPILLLLAFAPALFAATTECERPELPSFDAERYYKGLARFEGDKLKAKLNERITHRDVQPIECAETILSRLLPDAGPVQPRPVWPRERGFPNDIQDAYSDLYNLLPARAGVRITSGDSRKWKIPPVLKGDVARILLYMDTRYDGDDASLTPDLSLLRGPAPRGKPSLGRLCDLLAWHEQDPVSPTERLRNDLIWQWQGNRNPFVDHPEWVKRVYQVDCTLPDISDREGLLKRLDQLERELHAIRRQLQEGG